MSARKSSLKTQSAAVFSFSGLEEEHRFDCSAMTARDIGWDKSVFPRGGSHGGRNRTQVPNDWRLAELLVRTRNTEKTSAVVGKQEDSQPGTEPDSNATPPPGHGRNGAEAFGGARKVDIKHQHLTHGDLCPECGKGNVYGQKEPKVLVRIVGQAPLAATVYSLERLRCGACGQVFTAQEPEAVGPDKYDETAAAMIAQLKYGAGTPFNRLEQLESQLGIPLPAATQWEIVEEEAQVIKPARDELIRQSAQGTVVHNDDTSMRVLMLKRNPSDERAGVFTSGIVLVGEDRKIALYFTGSRHAARTSPRC
jgi:transposase